MSQRGKYVRTTETLARMRASAKGKQPWLGKRHTPEAREKIAASNRKRIRSDSYTRGRKDWMEVCRACHKRLDAEWGEVGAAP